MAVVMIGVDPHKGSHTAVAAGADERPLGEVRVRSLGRSGEAAAAVGDGLARAGLSGGRRRRAGAPAGLATAGRRRAGAGRAAQAGRAGTAAGLRGSEQERPERRPPGGRCRAALAVLPAGLSRRPRHGAEDLGQAVPRPGPVPYPGGLPAARGAAGWFPAVWARRYPPGRPGASCRRPGLPGRPGRPAWSLRKNSSATCATPAPALARPGRSWPRRCWPQARR